MTIQAETRNFFRLGMLLNQHQSPSDEIITYWNQAGQLVFTLKGCPAEVTVVIREHPGVDYDGLVLECRETEISDLDTSLSIPDDVTDDELASTFTRVIGYIKHPHDLF